jgi:hypothetical protein
MLLLRMLCYCNAHINGAVRMPCDKSKSARLRQTARSAQALVRLAAAKACDFLKQLIS